MNKILTIVHQKNANPGLVGQLLTQDGYKLDIRFPCLGEKLPTTMDNHEAAVIFGGAMSANDSETLPFIRAELDWIPVALSSGKPFLGICLGGQLLARVLGAKVAPHPEGLTEIGYFRILPSDAAPSYFNFPRYVYHWHREGFELPTGARLLAEGETFPNQAFRYGNNAYGVQFHPEMNQEMLEIWTHLGANLLNLPGAQPRDEQLKKHSLYGSQAEHWLQGFLRSWLQGAEANKKQLVISD